MPGFEVIDEKERQAVDRIFTHGNGILFAHGFDALREKFYVREFETSFAKRMGAHYALAVSSGSAALVVALKALGIKPGDEVITQSFTFVATVEAILMLGATPVITEVDDTYNMDPKDLATKISPKTKAIIPVHMAGVPARMDEICQIARESNIFVLEDTAQGIGGTVNGKMCGTIGDIGIYSLDFGKTITCGEGGVVVTNNKALYQRCLEFHDHGHEYNPAVGRAEDTRSTWGLNFRMNEMSAAVASVQLSKLDSIISKAQKVKTHIQSALLEMDSEIVFRSLPANSQENYDSIVFSLPTIEKTQVILANLKEHGIGTKNVPDALRWHFAGHWEHMFENQPLYEDCYETAWPNSEQLLSRSIALPVMVSWDEEQLDDYIGKLKQCFLCELA
jgi:8-amino-3,8-dideoxy-alpha-D-manno-octulosonate transaminase